jgi:hypothetical protein
VPYGIAIGNSVAVQNTASIVIGTSIIDDINNEDPGLFINPIRTDTTAYPNGTPGVLYYKPGTSEVVYASNTAPCVNTIVEATFNGIVQFYGIDCDGNQFGPQPGFSYKSFVIDHPIKPDNYLVHVCLEGPEAGVYYRGTTQVCDKFVEVELPDYVDSLAKDFTVHVTHIFDEDVDTEPKTYSATKVKDGKFKIYGPKGKVSWVVFGSRGNIEVEPLKSSVNIKGDGPYKYI